MTLASAEFLLFFVAVPILVGVPLAVLAWCVWLSWRECPEEASEEKIFEDRRVVVDRGRGWMIGRIAFYDDFMVVASCWGTLVLEYRAIKHVRSDDVPSAMPDKAIQVFYGSNGESESLILLSDRKARILVAVRDGVRRSTKNDV